MIEIRKIIKIILDHEINYNILIFKLFPMQRPVHKKGPRS